ncbi:unnamed protein product [Amoebophrya sp. A120]|nr:unnamed protein product [Amoebophrya sp. A120]|eukprot:GSA120T00020965001.1
MPENSGSDLSKPNSPAFDAAQPRSLTPNKKIPAPPLASSKTTAGEVPLDNHNQRGGPAGSGTLSKSSSSSGSKIVNQALSGSATRNNPMNNGAANTSAPAAGSCSSSATAAGGRNKNKKKIKNFHVHGGLGLLDNSQSDDEDRTTATKGGKEQGTSQMTSSTGVGGQHQQGPRHGGTRASGASTSSSSRTTTAAGKTAAGKTGGPAEPGIILPAGAAPTAAPAPGAASSSKMSYKDRLLQNQKATTGGSSGAAPSSKSGPPSNAAGASSSTSSSSTSRQKTGEQAAAWSSSTTAGTIAGAASSSRTSCEDLTRNNGKFGTSSSSFDRFEDADQYDEQEVQSSQDVESLLVAATSTLRSSGQRRSTPPPSLTAVAEHEQLKVEDEFPTPSPGSSLNLKNGGASSRKISLTIVCDGNENRIVCDGALSPEDKDLLDRALRIAAREGLGNTRNTNGSFGSTDSSAGNSSTHSSTQKPQSTPNLQENSSILQDIPPLESPNPGAATAAATSSRNEDRSSQITAQSVRSGPRAEDRYPRSTGAVGGGGSPPGGNKEAGGSKRGKLRIKNVPMTSVASGSSSALPEHAAQGEDAATYHERPGFAATSSTSSSSSSRNNAKRHADGTTDSGTMVLSDFQTKRLFPLDLPSKMEPIGAGCVDPAAIRFPSSTTSTSIPRTTASASDLLSQHERASSSSGGGRSTRGLGEDHLDGGVQPIPPMESSREISSTSSSSGGQHQPQLIDLRTGQQLVISQQNETRSHKQTASTSATSSSSEDQVKQVETGVGVVPGGSGGGASSPPHTHSHSSHVQKSKKQGMSNHNNKAASSASNPQLVVTQSSNLSQFGPGMLGNQIHTNASSKKSSKGTSSSAHQSPNNAFATSSGAPATGHKFFQGQSGGHGHLQHQSQHGSSKGISSANHSKATATAMGTAAVAAGSPLAAAAPSSSSTQPSMKFSSIAAATALQKRIAGLTSSASSSLSVDALVKQKISPLGACQSQSSGANLMQLHLDGAPNADQQDGSAPSSSLLFLDHQLGSTSAPDILNRNSTTTVISDTTGTDTVSPGLKPINTEESLDADTTWGAELGASLSGSIKDACGKKPEKLDKTELANILAKAMIPAIHRVQRQKKEERRRQRAAMSSTTSLGSSVTSASNIIAGATRASSGSLKSRNSSEVLVCQFDERGNVSVLERNQHGTSRPKVFSLEDLSRRRDTEGTLADVKSVLREYLDGQRNSSSKPLRKAADQQSSSSLFPVGSFDELIRAASSTTPMTVSESFHALGSEGNFSRSSSIIGSTTTSVAGAESAYNYKERNSRGHRFRKHHTGAGSSEHSFQNFKSSSSMRKVIGNHKALLLRKNGREIVVCIPEGLAGGANSNNSAGMLNTASNKNLMGTSTTGGGSSCSTTTETAGTRGATSRSSNKNSSHGPGVKKFSSTNSSRANTTVHEQSFEREHVPFVSESPSIDMKSTSRSVYSMHPPSRVLGGGQSSQQFNNAASSSSVSRGGNSRTMNKMSAVGPISERGGGNHEMNNNRSSRRSGNNRNKHNRNQDHHNTHSHSGGKRRSSTSKMYEIMQHGEETPPPPPPLHAPAYTPTAGGTPLQAYMTAPGSYGPPPGPAPHHHQQYGPAAHIGPAGIQHHGTTYYPTPAPTPTYHMDPMGNYQQALGNPAQPYVYMQIPSAPQVVYHPLGGYPQITQLQPMPANLQPAQVQQLTQQPPPLGPPQPQSNPATSISITSPKQQHHAATLNLVAAGGGAGPQMPSSNNAATQQLLNPLDLIPLPSGGDTCNSTSSAGNNSTMTGTTTIHASSSTSSAGAPVVVPAAGAGCAPPPMDHMQLLQQIAQGAGTTTLGGGATAAASSTSTAQHQQLPPQLPSTVAAAVGGGGAPAGGAPGAPGGPPVPPINPQELLGLIPREHQLIGTMDARGGITFFNNALQSLTGGPAAGAPPSGGARAAPAGAPGGAAGGVARTGPG